MPDNDDATPAGADGDPRSVLADLLIAARRDRRPLPLVSDDLIPGTISEANAVDDLVAERIGRPIAGWKIGCTSEHAQAMLGTDGPFAGRVYDLHPSGAEVEAEAFPAEAYLEGEFAFTLADGLPVTPVERTRDEVVAAIASVRPAIEVVGGRWDRFVGAPLHCLVADAGANGFLVLGDPVQDWQPDDLPQVGATMTVDGEVTGEGRGADVLGHPLDALVWLVNHLGARGIGLDAGLTVTTGTATQVSPLPPGSTATATLAGIGSVTLHRSS